ncbi:MFS transporter [Opitutus sp. ER46]|nr:MFS transporter [Opitutus sp. ER46]
MRRLRWAVFLSGTLGYSLYYVCRLSLSVVKTPLVREGVLTESQLGLIGSGLFYAYAAGKLINGFLADRANITRFLALGLLGTAVVNLVLGFNPGFLAFLLLWLASGWCQSMGSPACVVGLSRWFSREQRGTYYGLWSASHNIGEGLTFVAVALVSSTFGWRWGFWGAAGAGLMGVVIVWLFFHNQPPGAQPTVQAADHTRLAPEERRRIRALQWSVVKSPEIWLIAAASAFMYIARYSINSWGVFYLEMGKGYAPVQAGSIISINAVCGVLGTIASGWVTDRWFADNRFMPALLAGLLNAVSLGAFLAIPGGHVWLDAACMVGFGISIGALICFLGGLLAIDCVPKEVAGAALGTVGIASYIGAGTQDAVSGFLIEGGKVASGTTTHYDFTVAALFWFSASALSALVTAIVWRRSRRRQAAAAA